MSLSHTFQQLEDVETLNTCLTCTWYLDLDDEDQRFFDSTISSRRFNRMRLMRACQQMGLEVSETAFRRHLRQKHDPCHHGIYQ